MIDYDAFLKWAEDNFPDVEASGEEIKINSVFEDDTKRHMWCNPSKNAYHCWKSEKSGNLFELVCHVSKCSYHEAVSILSSDNTLRSLEDKLDKFFSDKAAVVAPKPVANKLELPVTAVPIGELPKAQRQKAEDYLTSRKIGVGNLMYCTAGPYRDRIVIPYYSPDGTLIYWNTRDITGKSKLRYLGPDAKLGVGKGDVIFAQEWPRRGDKLYLTEGEFDALSLSQCGLNGAACGGKALVNKQIELLRPYRICICFDTDKSGEIALHKIGDKLIESGIQDVSYVRPPVDDKKMDWNRMLLEYGESITSLYVTSREKPFTYWTSKMLRFNNR